MKVVMLCEFYNEELDYQEVMLAKYYCEIGHDVVVITGSTTSIYDYMGNKSTKTDHWVEDGKYARIYRMPVFVTFLKRIYIYRSIRKIVESERPDLLFFHDIIPNMLETKAYLQENPQVCAIMDYHADYSNSGANRLSRLLLHRLSRRMVLRRMRSRLSAILPIVPGSQRFLADLYEIPVHETELFPLGVDVREVKSVKKSDARYRVRHQLGIADDAMVIFTGGKLTRLKRTEEILRAVASFNDPDIHVIVVGTVSGDGAYESLLKDAAGPTTHFVGWQDRQGVYDHQAASDLAVFPASQSVLWQQSIGMGLPLVVSDGSDQGRARQDVSYMNRGNIHVLTGSDQLSTQIAAFLDLVRHKPETLTQMAEAAEKITHDLLSYERLARRTLEIANQHRIASGAHPLPIDAG